MESNSDHHGVRTASEDDGKTGVLPRLSQDAAHLIGLLRRRFPNCPRYEENLPYRLTASGVWARSRPEHLFYFFSKINLSRFRLFVDLGSGDGTACLVAALFTRSIGLEADTGLVLGAGRTARELGMSKKVGFIRADFFTQRIRNSDCLFIYPDKPIYRIEDLLEGWKGTLLVYGPHFPPRKLEKVEQLNCGKERLSVYRFVN